MANPLALTETKAEYVRRKVERNRKDRSRTQEFEGTKPDKQEDEHDDLETKHAAEDWWDLWEF